MSDMRNLITSSAESQLITLQMNITDAKQRVRFHRLLD